MNALKGIATGIASVILAITLFAAGFGVCCLPFTTQLLSQATSDTEHAPYTPEQLTTLAIATRSFTVDDYGRSTYGDVGAETALANAILQAAQSASAEGSTVADRWNTPARTAVESAASSNATSDAIFGTLAAVSDNYALDADAVSHLQDCNVLIRTATPWLWACAVASFLVLAVLHLANKRNPRCTRTAARICTIAPCVLLVLLAAAAAWAATDFNGFFSAFHGVFFPQGNWTFSYDSLLICMYPIRFWMGMGAIWAAMTVLCCIASLALGRKLRRL